MSRDFFGKLLKAFLCIGLAIVMAGCSRGANRPDMANAGSSSGAFGSGNAVPGSEKDFIVNVGDRVLFPTDMTSLTSEAKDILRRQAAWLKQYSNVRVQVSGHADERGTREYNIALSARRASVVKTYLSSLGVSTSRISTIAYGKEKPVSLCDAESCWSQNRRAVTVIMSRATS